MRVCLIALALAVCPLGGLAQEGERTFTVTGEATVEAAPDFATIEIGVETQALDVPTAVADNNAAMEAVMARLREAGIAGKDIRTSIFTIHRQRDEIIIEIGDERRREPDDPVVVVSNQVLATIRNLESIGDVLAAVSRDGANVVNDLSFEVDDPREHVGEARRAAANEAQEKAEVYSEALGITLGPIRRVYEGERHHIGDGVIVMEPEIVLEEASVPISVRTVSFRATVTVEYTIE